MKSKKNIEQKILRGLDFFRDYSRCHLNVRKGEFQLITNNLLELAKVVREPLPREKKEFLNLWHPFRIEQRATRKSKKKDIETFDIYSAANLVNIGILYWTFGEFKKAEESYSRALKICRQLAKQDPDIFEPDLAETINYLGNLYRNLKEIKKAEKFYTEALGIYRELAERDPDMFENVAGTLNNLGTIYSDLKEFEKAKKYYIKALGIRRELAEKDPDAFNPFLAITLNNLGSLYRDLREFKEAEEHSSEALKVFRELAEKEPEVFEPYLAMTLNNFGNLYSDLRKFKKAEESYTEALKIYRELTEKYPDDFDFYMAETFNNLGGLNYDLRRFGKAENYYSKAKAIFNKLAERDPDTSRFGLAITLNNIGSLYRDLGEFEIAEKSYTEALKIYRELGEKEALRIRKDAETIISLFNKYKDGISQKEIYRSLQRIPGNIYKEFKNYKAGDVIKIDKTISSWTHDKDVLSKFTERGSNNIHFYLKEGRRYTSELDIEKYSLYKGEKEILVNTKEFKIIKTDDSEPVLLEDKIFYERLAVDLISLTPEDQEICDVCEQELCPICEAHSDEIHKCYNCNAKYHSCCAAKYSLAKNIGFRHVFRCLQCETLLKLDEEFVNMIYEEDLEEELPDIEIQETSTEKHIIEEEEQVVKAVEEFSISEPEPVTPIETKKVRVGGFFGKEITIDAKNLKTKILTEGSQSIQITEKPISITNLKPPRKRGTATIKLCKICGATIQNTANCPTCGAKLD